MFEKFHVLFSVMCLIQQICEQLSLVLIDLSTIWVFLKLMDLEFKQGLGWKMRNLPRLGLRNYQVALELCSSFTYICFRFKF